MKYDPEGEVCADHDIISVSPQIGAIMDIEDQADLQKMGWHHDPKYSSWSIFV